MTEVSRGNRKIRPFKCTQCDVWADLLVYDDVKEHECANCGGIMQRKLSAPAGSGNAAHGMLFGKSRK